jgi:hypothetical protein
MRKQRFQVGVSDQNVLRRTATFLKPSVFFGYFFFGNAKKSNISNRSKTPKPNINLNPLSIKIKQSKNKTRYPIQKNEY